MARGVTLSRMLWLALLVGLLLLAGVEFWNITWGTGAWLGQFSPRWGLAFLLFAVAALAGLVTAGLASFAPQRLQGLARPLLGLRRRLGPSRWVLSAVLLMLPMWLLQYTAWGLIMDGPGLRLTLWLVSALLIGFLLTGTEHSVLSWPAWLAALLLSAAAIKFTAAAGNVTSYPFSLGWSEGNRMWDYSILFGRRLYNYPPDQPIPVLLDIGRQFVGGLPFLLPGLTIWQERLWLALVNILPYLILGWMAFRRPAGLSPVFGFLAALWAYTFVEQGPIHPPLLLCAILVAFAWRKPLWLAIPVIAAASYFAVVSRYTWLFAPGMWAAMLELSGASLQAGRLDRTAWTRAVAVGLAGILGGYLAPFFLPGLISRWLGGSDVVSSLGSGVILSDVGTEAGSQALLWYRLFPNATYGYGILIGLLIAVTPLIGVLVYLAVTRRWTLKIWQQLAIVLPLLAFLGVGLIVSVKIGGGGDLHNLDMFIIGLMFAAAIAWQNGGADWLAQLTSAPTWIRVVLVLLVGLPAYQALFGLQPIAIREDLRWVMALADIPPTGPMPELLPSAEDTEKSLNDVRAAVAEAARRGEVLFMDQRQLLTFGYVENVPLVPDYDKKVLINQAMSADEGYFATFYQDLAAQRFALIVTNPLHERIQTDLDQFGEENNAWVTWVSTPVLCYYEPLDTLKKVTVQLLVPREHPVGCEQVLPTALP